jgi:hypothetical protein
MRFEFQENQKKKKKKKKPKTFWPTAATSGRVAQPLCWGLEITRQVDENTSCHGKSRLTNGLICVSPKFTSERQLLTPGWEAQRGLPRLVNKLQDQTFARQYSGMDLNLNSSLFQVET